MGGGADAEDASTPAEGVAAKENAEAVAEAREAVKQAEAAASAAAVVAGPQKEVEANVSGGEAAEDATVRESAKDGVEYATGPSKDSECAQSKEAAEHGEMAASPSLDPLDEEKLASWCPT